MLNVVTLSGALGTKVSVTHATVAAAALLADLASERDGEWKLRIGQGVDMGRPSLLLTRVRKANGTVAPCPHMSAGSACR